VRAQLGPGFKNVLPAERKLANRIETHSRGQERVTSRNLVQDVTKTVGPDGMAREESTDPLSLQSLGLDSRIKEAEPADRAGAATNLDVRRQARVVIPNGFPAQATELIKNSRRGRRNAELVPQTAEEQGGNAERTALKGQAARQNVLGDRFQSVVERVPVLLDSFG
jgi:hypothetical protein